MIVVKIELWPHGIRSKAREIGRIVIANDASGDAQRGNYKVALAHAGIYAGKPGAWKGGRVLGHLRSLSPYHLIRSAIDACLRGNWPTAEERSLVDCTREGQVTPGERYEAERASKQAEFDQGGSPQSMPVRTGLFDD